MTIMRRPTRPYRPIVVALWLLASLVIIPSPVLAQDAAGASAEGAPQAITPESIAENRTEYERVFNEHQAILRNFHAETLALFRTHEFWGRFLPRELVGLVLSASVHQYDRVMDKFSGLKPFYRGTVSAIDLTAEEQSLLCLRDVAFDIHMSRVFYNDAFFTSGPIWGMVTLAKGGNLQEAKRCVQDMHALEKNREYFCEFADPLTIIDEREDFVGFVRERGRINPAMFFHGTRLDCQQFLPRLYGFTSIDQMIEDKAQRKIEMFEYFDQIERGERPAIETADDMFDMIDEVTGHDDPAADAVTADTPDGIDSNLTNPPINAR